MFFILLALVWSIASGYGLHVLYTANKGWGVSGAPYRDRSLEKFVVPSIVGTGLALVVAFSVVPIGTSKIGVGRSFGQTYESLYKPGIHFQAPWNSFERYEGVPLSFIYDGDVISGDKNPLKVSVGFATKINENLAWRLQEALGTEFQEKLVEPAGQTAVRRGISEFPWETAATGDRSAVEQAIQREFSKIIVEQMVASGMSEQEATSAFTIFPVQLRQSLPDLKVLNSIAEKTAATVDLERQVTLTSIAEEEAKRRKNEGEGVRNLFAELPEAFTPAEISSVLMAFADKTRADAMLKAVESAQVGTIS